ncbi:MAG: DUF4416 family protein [Candidatus Aminicenantes bacterium]
MTEAKTFRPVKLICGIIALEEKVFKNAEIRLESLYGPKDFASPFIEFTFTDYYEKEMGKGLRRKFLSFKNLIAPERLSEIKVRTNRMEQEMREAFRAAQRIVNLDPGFLTSSALFMATAKDFAHRVPLQHGIYAHLELLFGKKDVRSLDWTYPDYTTEEYQNFFLRVRKKYLLQLKG